MPKKLAPVNINSHISHYRTYSDDADNIYEHKQSAFPKDADYTGFLDFRLRSTKPWRRRYFVLSNNFLLIGATPHSEKLDKVIPLEGSNVKTSTKISTLTFQIKKYHFRAGSDQECEIWCKKIEKASKLKIKDVYQFKELLGSNAQGTTKVIAARHRITSTLVAVKQISKKAYNQKSLSNEVLILKRLEHPNVVKLHDVFETKRHVYLVMEKCTGGELFEKIAEYSSNELNQQGFTERDCIQIMHQIAKAIQYMHKQGIVHRDLKPENVLCANEKKPFLNIKIADFGISKVLFDPEQKRLIKEKIKWKKELESKQNIDEIPKKFVKNSSKQNIIHPLQKKKKNQNQKHKMASKVSYGYDKMMQTMCGTISYTAPEILKEKPYDHRVDYWSLGVIMYILLCGYPPFYGDTELDAAQSILYDDVELDPDDWSHVSDNGKKLVLGLLSKNPKQRSSCKDILSHSWIYNAKKISSSNSRISLRKTVMMRKIRKNSMSAFEKKSKRINKIYRFYDDTTPKMDRKSSNSISSLGNGLGRFSKTEEDLMTLHIPNSISSPRKQDSIDYFL